MKNLKRSAFGLSIFITLLCATGCTRTDQATMVLKNEGYTDIKITGYALFMCGEDDTFSTEFTAKNRNGQIVSGAVCSGLLKGATIRY
jgi:hypothetical protein